MATFPFALPHRCKLAVREAAVSTIEAKYGIAGKVEFVLRTDEYTLYQIRYTDASVRD